MGGKTKKETVTDNSVDEFTRQNYNTAAGNARNFMDMSYNGPYTGERVANMSANEADALGNYMSNAQSNRGIMEQGLSMAQQNADYNPDQVQTQNFTDMDITGYMNPYINEVINNTLSDIERKQIGSAENIDAQAARASAFGGSRQAIQQAENERNYSDIAAKTSAQMRQQGFNEAAVRMQADAARQLQADRYNQSANIQGADMRMRNAAEISRMAGNMTEADARNYAIQQQYGQSERGIEQARMDAQYQEELRRQQAYMNMARMETGLMGPTITDSNQTQTTSGGGIMPFVGDVLSSGLLGNPFPSIGRVLGFGESAAGGGGYSSPSIPSGGAGNY